MQTSCPICLELFDGSKDVGANNCGHVYHFQCINKWLDNSKVCPECRGPVNKKSILKLYFNNSGNDTVVNVNCLENELDTLKAQLKAKDSEKSDLNKKVNKLQKYVADAESNVEIIRQQLLATQLEFDMAKCQLKDLNGLKEKVKKLSKSNEHLMTEMEHFNRVQVMVQGTQSDVEDILQEMGSEASTGPAYDVAKRLASMCSILKRELSKVVQEKNQLKKKERNVSLQFALQSVKLVEAEKNCRELTERFTKYDLNHSYASQASPLSTRPENPKCNVSLMKTPQQSSSSYSKETEEIDMTPISVNFSGKKRSKLDVVVVDNVCKKPLKKVTFASQVQNLSSIKRLDKDEDSISRVGYNGLGGHECTIFAKYRMLNKPYKKNPSIRKLKSVS